MKPQFKADDRNYGGTEKHPCVKGWPSKNNARQKMTDTFQYYFSMQLRLFYRRFSLSLSFLGSSFFI